jgi:hypothetical protein
MEEAAPRSPGNSGGRGTQWFSMRGNAPDGEQRAAAAAAAAATGAAAASAAAAAALLHRQRRPTLHKDAGERETRVQAIRQPVSKDADSPPPTSHSTFHSTFHPFSTPSAPSLALPHTPNS